MSEKNQEPEYTVVCVDCKNPQDSQYVMNSVWYKQGLTPPCKSCGGVTSEIPVAQMEQFIKDRQGGVRKI